MNNWVRFHAQLRQGEKRGIPRAWRFVYMELSHEARERGGWIALPLGMGDVDGVHELLGGKRQEVADAIKLFTSSDDPMLSFGVVDGKRAIIVNNWRKWNPQSDDSTERVRKKRREDDVKKLAASNADVTVTVTEEKQGVTPRARALLSSPLLSSVSEGEPERESEPSAGESGVHPAHAVALGEPGPEPRLAARNATGDGVWGMGVSNWVDGIRSVTGKPFTAPRGGSAELAKLIDAMLDHCPDASAREQWAFRKGADFARTNKGKLSAHSFADWLNSPEAGSQPGSIGGPVVDRVARAQQRSEDAKLEAEGALPVHIGAAGVLEAIKRRAGGTGA